MLEPSDVQVFHHIYTRATSTTIWIFLWDEFALGRQDNPFRLVCLSICRRVIWQLHFPASIYYIVSLSKSLKRLKKRRVTSNDKRDFDFCFLLFLFLTPTSLTLVFRLLSFPCSFTFFSSLSHFFPESWLSLFTLNLRSILFHWRSITFSFQLTNGRWEFTHEPFPFLFSYY